MKFKNTFYNWLTNGFILIIRKEENFAIKHTFRLNYAKLMVLGISLGAVFFILSLYLVSTSLSKWFNPKYAQLQTERRLIVLAANIDSLSHEIEQKDAFIHHFKDIMEGKEDDVKQKTPKKGNLKRVEHVNLDKISVADSLLRNKFEKMESMGAKPRERLFKDVYFFRPVEGLVVENFEQRGKGIKIRAIEKDPVKAIIDGSIIQASTIGNNEKLLILENDKLGLFVKYQFRGAITKEEGDWVDAGEAIGLLAKKTLVGFEIWHKGKPVNPLYFVSF